jgi:hypothetical protein
MSFSNAIRQREQMITQYRLILETETNPERILDIQNQIDLVQDEIAQLKAGKPLFGKPRKIIQATRLIEPDPEKKGQDKITILSSLPPLVPPTTTPITRLENSLRAKIQSAKAAKKA